MSMIGVIKEHPYVAGGAVLATVVIVFAVTGGKSDTAGAVVASSGVASDPNQSALLAAQVNAGVRTNEISAQLDALGLQADVARHAADLEYGVKLTESNNATDIAKAAYGVESKKVDAVMLGITSAEHVALGAQETDRFKSKLVSDENITASNNTLAAALDTNRTIINVNNVNAGVKMHADELAATTANHAIDATMTERNFEAGLASATAQQIAANQTAASMFMASTNANAAVAMNAANNDHGSYFGGLFQW